MRTRIPELAVAPQKTERRDRAVRMETAAMVQLGDMTSGTGAAIGSHMAKKRARKSRPLLIVAAGRVHAHAVTTLVDR